MSHTESNLMTGGILTTLVVVVFPVWIGLPVAIIFGLSVISAAGRGEI